MTIATKILRCNPLNFKKRTEVDIQFKTTEELSIHPDAKEAVLFAVLANEALCGGSTNFGEGIPNVSMGKISFPN